jgi:soluble lytic murein transglycosylase-like protein
MDWIWIMLAAFAAAASEPPVASAPSTRERPPAFLVQQRAAIAQQRASIRKQAESVLGWMLPWPDGPPARDPPACDPIADDIVAPIIDSAAKAQDVEPKLIRAMVERESGFRPCAVSEKGAQGLMQLMPETAQELEVQDPFDPGQNIQAGAKYLKQLLDKYKGDLAQALAAYNAGPTTVDQSGGIPDIPETRDYVDAILEKLGIKRAADHQ